MALLDRLVFYLLTDTNHIVRCLCSTTYFFLHLLILGHFIKHQRKFLGSNLAVNKSSRYIVCDCVQLAISQHPFSSCFLAFKTSDIDMYKSSSISTHAMAQTTCELVDVDLKFIRSPRLSSNRVLKVLVPEYCPAGLVTLYA